MVSQSEVLLSNLQYLLENDKESSGEWFGDMEQNRLQLL